MQFKEFRASGALMLALCGVWSGFSAQAQSANAANTASSGSPAAGPGLMARQWQSATDWQAWQNTGHWRWVISPFSHHYRYNEEHRYVWAVGLERQRGDDWLAGASYFSNSFGQPSAYLYAGKRFPALWGQSQLFGQASAGLMYGYRGKYQHKVPANYKGFSPGALLSLGWQFTPQAAVTAHMLGDAGLMFQLSYELK
jgi:hypothetical protein